MCGIAGFTCPAAIDGPSLARERRALQAMVAALRHRGPDALTGRIADGVALGHARLSIVDLEGGAQPMRDPVSGRTVVFNGEIFNHVELRQRLAAGYDFRTHSDTEVILAAFAAWGIDCVTEFNGQFAFAIHDPLDGSLWFARDRFGKRPFHYAWVDGEFVFASEAKALFASGKMRAELDPSSLWETLHLWAPADGHSMFRGVNTLPAGSVGHLPRGGELTVRRYWDFDLSDELVDRGMSDAAAMDELGELLNDAVRLRLRADVPVAAYLSGGLDSTLLCALAQQQLGGSLQTFSLAFAQERYDERAFQEQVAAALQTAHRSVVMRDDDIGSLLPEVVHHAESVLLRSAPAPLYKLSELVRDSGTKVVLTGEGADELFGGYDLFKEVQVRQFWAREPASTWRPALFRKLYPYLQMSKQGQRLTQEFYGAGIDQPQAWDFSHRIRWSNSGRIGRFLAEDVLAELRGSDPTARLRDSLHPGAEGWRPLARAQHLEVRTLLSQYLLSSQGDRMLMANSVEGRFPFLDHRIAEFSARLPDGLKLRGLTEKVLLKHFGVGRVPTEVIARHKFPYRAPIAEALVGPGAPAWSRALLDRDAVERVGLFDGSKVERLVAKLERGAPPSEADNMSLMAIASTQLLDDIFVRRQEAVAPAELDAVVVA